MEGCFRSCTYGLFRVLLCQWFRQFKGKITLSGEPALTSMLSIASSLYVDGCVGGTFNELIKDPLDERIGSSAAGLETA